MKQAILTFEKCKVVLIESDKGSKDVFRMKDPPKRMKYIGKLSELTEEEAREIVDSWLRYFPEQHTVYRNYEKPTEYDAVKGSSEQKWDEPFGKAVESFLSKLRVEGCCMENPAGTYEEACRSYDANSHAYEKSQFDLGESLTFSPDKTWVFTIKQ